MRAVAVAENAQSTTGVVQWQTLPDILERPIRPCVPSLSHVSSGESLLRVLSTSMVQLDGTVDPDRACVTTVWGECASHLGLSKATRA